MKYRILKGMSVTYRWRKGWRDQVTSELTAMLSLNGYPLVTPILVPHVLCPRDEHKTQNCLVG